MSALLSKSPFSDREIKFRAWDGKVMIDEPIIHMEPPLSMNMVVNPSKYDICGKDFKLMQYTGLKDRDGKEIYEGDLYREEYSFVGVLEDASEIDVHTFFIAKIIYNCYGYIAEVVVAKDTAKYGGRQYKVGDTMALSIYDKDIQQGFVDSIKIIGNIYENEDLLTPKSDKKSCKS